MLKSLDLLIGVTVVMLVVSLAVTMVTQMAVGLLNTRGKALKDGVAQLLFLMDNGIDHLAADRIADHILRDPLIAPIGLFGRGRRLAAVVQREELTKLLLAFAQHPDADAQPARSPGVSDLEVVRLRELMAASLARNGVADSQATLQAIRLAALDLEKSNPTLSNSQRSNSAILDCARSNFLGKLNGWFDQTIDRVTDRFTHRARGISSVVALVVAVGLQLDALQVINRLSADDKVREQLVGSVLANSAAYDPAAPAAVTPAAPGPAAPPAPALSSGARSRPCAHDDGHRGGDEGAPVDCAVRRASRDALFTGIVDLPGSPGAWMKGWTQGSTIAGVALSALLLSLGAPFWYESLKSLLKLRGVMAKKDDTARSERQTDQTGDAGGGG